jgi:hypothetical protein
LREEIQRISKLVAEGKLSPEDAADLIDAFYAVDRMEEEGAPTPPPAPDAPGAARDPFKTIVDQIERLTKESVDSVNWGEVSKQARHSAKKGLEALRHGLEDISKGKININLFGSHERKEISLPLGITEGKTLKIENECGDVRITGGVESGSVTAVAKFRGSSPEDARAKAQEYTVIIEESDHQVLIRQPEVSGLEVDLDIRVPSNVQVELRTQMGDVHVSDTGSGCRVKARHGDIRLRGLNGAIEVSAESGDISVESSETTSLSVENKSGNIRVDGVRGNVNIRTATGDLHVVNSAGKVVALETISGDVLVDLEEPVSGTLNVRTVSGDARVGVPDGSDCRVTLATLRGDVNCNLQLDDEARAQQRVTGKLGEGSGTIDVSAVTGDILLELRNHQTAQI